MRRLWGGIAAIGAGFGVFLACIAVLWIYFLKHSDFYAACLEFAHAHPDLRPLVGEITAMSALPIGYYLESVHEGTGDGRVAFAVHGTNGKAWLLLTGYRRFAHWVIERAAGYTGLRREPLTTVDDLMEDVEQLSDAALHERMARAMAIQPGVPEPHFLLGERYLERAEFGRAATAFRAALARDGTYAPAHNDLGVALMGQKAYAEALPVLAAAAAYAPDDPLPLVNQALIYADVPAYRDLVQARSFLEQAAVIDPDLPMLYEIWAKVYRLEGDPDAAERAERRAASLRQ